jgi:hypothetical protein
MIQTTFFSHSMDGLLKALNAVPPPPVPDVIEYFDAAPLWRPFDDARSHLRATCAMPKQA